MKNLLFVFVFTFSNLLFAQEKPAYNIFDKNGNAVSYQTMLENTAKADIVFIGELHNNPIAHWMEFEITKDIFEKYNEKMVLGAEMYEADNQEMINEYLQDKITYKTFKEQARLWPNNETDYQPLLDFAKKNKLHFVAANVPRRYANIVYKSGLEALNDISKEAQKWIAPLPIKYDGELKCYKEMLAMMGGHGGDNIPKSQALKDATMAYFIIENIIKDGIFIHYNGAYHSNNYQGIVWYIKDKKPKLNVATITTVEQDDINKLSEESKNLADFIICVPSSMTKTY
jgi:uncharacterized iron-regulated protein